MDIVKKIIEFVMDILETVTFVGSLFIVVYLFIMHPHQGDVVVFSSPDNKDIDFIKRIIALPGEKIRIENNTIYINGKALKEQYIEGQTLTLEDAYLKEGQEEIIPNGHIFVMGDNRQRSSDSRMFGPVPTQDIIGRVFFRYFPPEKIGTIKNPFEQSLIPVRLVYQEFR